MYNSVSPRRIINKALNVYENLGLFKAELAIHIRSQ